MKNVKLILVATLTAATLGALGMQSLSAQQAGFKRVELQRGDLSVAGREAVVVRVEFDADGIVGRHTHPGEESTYIIEGSLLIEEFEILDRCTKVFEGLRKGNFAEPGDKPCLNLLEAFAGLLRGILLFPVRVDVIGKGCVLLAHG